MNIPTEILEAAEKLGRWCAEQGITVWEIGPCCSRNHAENAKRYEKLRTMAIVSGSLEAEVAINQLDYIKDERRFDATVDALPLR